METIAAMYELHELHAMADGPKLLARTSNAKTPQVQVYSDISHEQKPLASR